MSDLVERLRDRNAVIMSGLFHAVPAMAEAADEIERLREQLVKARAALDEIQDLGADDCSAARLGNIAHAALLSLSHDQGSSK